MTNRLMQIRGIKQGHTIKLIEEIALPDGCEIILEISRPMPLTPEEHWQQLCQLFGAWSEQPDLDEIFTEIAEKRHQNSGRSLLDFD